MNAAPTDATDATDVFAAWAAQVRAAPSGRADPDRDVAFWARQAARYDAGQPALPATLAWLAACLRGAASLLDVGAGTGRLALPLSGVVPLVTALDHSPDMLAELRAKRPPAHLHLRAQGLEAALRDPTLARHDAVLSAWSLAYQPDLRATLRGLLRLSGRHLILLEDDGVGSPHVNLRRALSGHPRPQRASRLRAALGALGHPPDHHRVQETRELVFPDLPALLAQARLPLPDADALAALRPHLTYGGGVWRYRWTFDVHVLHVRTDDRRDRRDLPGGQA